MSEQNPFVFSPKASETAEVTGGAERDQFLSPFSSSNPFAVLAAAGPLFLTSASTSSSGGGQDPFAALFAASSDAVVPDVADADSHMPPPLVASRAKSEGAYLKRDTGSTTASGRSSLPFHDFSSAHDAESSLSSSFWGTFAQDEDDPFCPLVAARSSDFGTKKRKSKPLLRDSGSGIEMMSSFSSATRDPFKQVHAIGDDIFDAPSRSVPPSRGGFDYSRSPKSKGKKKKKKSAHASKSALTTTLSSTCSSGQMTSGRTDIGTISMTKLSKSASTSAKTKKASTFDDSERHSSKYFEENEDSKESDGSSGSLDKRRRRTTSADPLPLVVVSKGKQWSHPRGRESRSRSRPVRGQSKAIRTLGGDPRDISKSRRIQMKALKTLGDDPRDPKSRSIQPKAIRTLGDDPRESDRKKAKGKGKSKGKSKSKGLGHFVKVHARIRGSSKGKGKGKGKMVRATAATSSSKTGTGATAMHLMTASARAKSKGKGKPKRRYSLSSKSHTYSRTLQRSSLEASRSQEHSRSSTSNSKSSTVSKKLKRTSSHCTLTLSRSSRSRLQRAAFLMEDEDEDDDGCFTVRVRGVERTGHITCFDAHPLDPVWKLITEIAHHKCILPSAVELSTSGGDYLHIYDTLDESGIEEHTSVFFHMRTTEGGSSSSIITSGSGGVLDLEDSSRISGGAAAAAWRSTGVRTRADCLSTSVGASGSRRKGVSVASATLDLATHYTMFVEITATCDSWTEMKHQRLNVPITASVFDLKFMYENEFEIPIENQRFFFESRELSKLDSSLREHYKVTEASTLRLIVAPFELDDDCHVISPRSPPSPMCAPP